MTDDRAIREYLVKALRRPAIIAAAAVVVVLAGGFVAWSATCPCERTPGAWLFGAANEEPVSDWTFANQVTLCQIQIRAGLLPHAINLKLLRHEHGRPVSELLAVRRQALVRLRGRQRPGAIAARRHRLPGHADPGARPDRARHGVDREARQAPRAGGAGQPTRAARHPEAGPLVVVPGRVPRRLAARGTIGRSLASDQRA